MEIPEKLRAEQIIIASNRGPVEYYLDQDNTLTYKLGPGGLVTALSQAAHLMEATWVAMALTEGDRLALERAQKENGGMIRSPLYNQKMHLRYVTVSEDTFDKYYGRITTELLWFTYSHKYDLAREIATDAQIADAWANGYCVANQAMAEAICGEIAYTDKRTVIMLQDFFLALVSSLIRERYPSVLMQQFLHWPWPDVRYLYQLPHNIIQAIIKGVLGNDLLGFQTERDINNFLDSVQMLLEDVVIDHKKRAVEWCGRQILLRAYPVTIDSNEVQRIAQSREGQQEIDQISHLLGKKIIMRVDRVDPVKNIVGGFHAYVQLLDDHPELLGEVVFLALLVPTREKSPAYQRYKREVFEIIEQINQKYGLSNWRPIHVFYGNNRVRALAAMQFYDALLINPTIDGMNLVAKEAAVVNRCDGILVLSPTAGASAQLGASCIPISPTNPTEIAQALYKVLTMTPEERQARSQQAHAAIESYDLNEWITRQIRDLNNLIDYV